MNRKYSACLLWEYADCEKCSHKWYQQFDTLKVTKQEKFIPLKYDKDTDTFIQPDGTRVKIKVVD